MTKITRTFVRTSEMMEKYLKNGEGKMASERTNIFADWKNQDVIKEFTHWVIIENNFPYDAIATTSHMIATKREVPFDWAQLSKEEIDEFSEIRKSYIESTYDVQWENLPHGRTIPGHFHLHLLVLKREEI